MESKSYKILQQKLLVLYISDEDVFFVYKSFDSLYNISNKRIIFGGKT